MRLSRCTDNLGLCMLHMSLGSIQFEGFHVIRVT